MKKRYLFSLLALAILGLSSCDKTNNNAGTNNPPTTDNGGEKEEITCSICKNFPTATKEVVNALPEYSPTKFNVDSVQIIKSDIAQGVIQSEYSFTKKDGKTSKVIVTEVDLSKAYIAAGTTDNSTSTLSKSAPIKQILAFEEANPTFNVVTGINADFFGGTNCVNAFVKDSIIIKDQHNDNGVYDYKDTRSDLPASMPMLFGISGQTAQIAPIIKNASVEETVKSKLFYELQITKNGETSTISNDVLFNYEEGSTDKINVITSKKASSALPDSKVLQVKKHQNDSTRYHGEITKIYDVTSNSFYKANDDYFYVIVPNSINFHNYELGDMITYNINSSDNTWKYYDTIIGCRQALVIDGVIPSTVSKENSNGAQTTNIPRTAIGVMPNGNVALFSVESLSYSKKNSPSDTYGLNLPELADFMRYYGVLNGANFDGGGSTQLISKNPSTGELEVKVRSSDYGTYDLSASRAVINTLLVYIKGN